MLTAKMVDSLIVIMTNLVVYWTLHSDFRTGWYDFISRISSATILDVTSPKLPLPEAAGWTI